jgi:hypothetical protein
MSLSNRLFLPVIVTTLAFLAGCGSSSPKAVPPPSGGFSNSNLTGTYVFSVSGTDVNGAAYAMVGTFTADGSGGNGTGGISAGTIDVNDEVFSTAVANSPLGSGSSYTVGVDGRGKATLVTSTPFKTITLDFVLASNAHGLVTEFDETASGSGTIDQQASGISQSSLSGSYAFSFSGVDPSGSNPFASVGNFTLDPSGDGSITAGLADFNDDGIPVPNEALGGQIILGPSSSPSTALIAQAYSLTYDVFAIDSTHLKFIEMDAGSPILSGDGYSQTSTTTIPAATTAFTLSGIVTGGVPIAAGGFMVTDGSGNITNSSTEDVNEGGTVVTAFPFRGTYSSAGTGRYTLSLASGFIGGTSYAAYPSSAGLLLLEIDNAGLTVGAGYPQSSPVPSFATPDGYGMNLTGFNLGAGSEVDDIAEFTAGSGGTLTSGIIDENYPTAAPPLFDLALTNGTFANLDPSGRYGISADAGTSSVTTLNGGFALTYYSVDGTTFPFIETDPTQVSSGVIVLQSSSGAAAAARSHVFIPRPLVHPHAAKSKKK